MRIRVHQHTTADPVIIDCDGVLDDECAIRLWEELDVALWQRSSRLVIDLSAAEYVDPEVLGVLAEMHHHAASLGGWVRLVVPPPVIWTLLGSTRIHRAVPVFRTVRAATRQEFPRHGNRGESPRTEGI